MEYLAYPLTTRVMSQNLQLEGGDAFKLPDVTICNMNPLSVRAYNESELLNFNNYMRLMNVTSGQLDYSNETVAATLELWKNDKVDAHAYYAWVGPEYASVIGHTQDELIALCKVLILKGVETVKRPCLTYVTIEQFLHPKYFNCYTLSRKYGQDTDIIVGYALQFQLANQESGFYKYMEDVGEYSMGALVNIHEPDTFPNMANGQRIPPGVSADLVIAMKERTLMPAPYGICQDNDHISQMLLEKYGLELAYEYTVHACIIFCLEHWVADTCDCRETYLLGTLNLTEAMFDDMDVCGVTVVSTPQDLTNLIGEGYQHKVPPWVEAELIQLKCSEATQIAASTACLNFCPVACVERSYDTSLSHDLWPVDPIAWPFYDNLIMGRPYEKHYTALQVAINERQNNSLSPADASSVIDQIRTNFISVKVSLSNLQILEMADEPMISPTTLISSVGGILNLWAGITVVLIVEVLEFFIRIFIPNKRPPKETALAHNNNNDSVDVKGHESAIPESKVVPSFLL